MPTLSSSGSIVLSSGTDRSVVDPVATGFDRSIAVRTVAAAGYRIVDDHGVGR